MENTKKDIFEKRTKDKNSINKRYLNLVESFLVNQCKPSFAFIIIKDREIIIW